MENIIHPNHQYRRIAHLQVSLFNIELYFHFIFVLEPPSQSHAPWDVTQWVDPIQGTHHKVAK